MESYHEGSGQGITTGLSCRYGKSASVKVCVRRPRCASRHHHRVGISKPSHFRTSGTHTSTEDLRIVRCCGRARSARTWKVGWRDCFETVNRRHHRRRASCRPQRGHHCCHRLHSTPACSRRPIPRGWNMAGDEDCSPKRAVRIVQKTR